MGKEFDPTNRKWEPLPKKYQREKSILKAVREKSALGLNKSALCRMFNLPVHVFIRYKEFYDAYMSGRDDLAEKVCVATINSDDYRDRNNIIQKMGLFTTDIHLNEITDIDSLVRAQGMMLEAFARGAINELQLNSFVKAAATMSQALFDRDVQSQLDELKDEIKGLKSAK